MLHLAILMDGMDANTWLVTCDVSEEGENGGTSSVHGFPNVGTRPAHDSLPDGLTTFAGTQTRGFKYTHTSIGSIWAVQHTLVTHAVYFILKQQKI